jgi:putative tributyrin esterase
METSRGITGRRSLRLAAAVVLAASAGALLWSATDTKRQNHGPVGQMASFTSDALRARLSFEIFLPAGYWSGARCYPVVYFLHGLPAGPTSFRNFSWVASALAATGHRAILVVPQATLRPGGDPEYHDWGPGDDWETALSTELPAYVDAHYRTIAARSGRAIVGISAGGYGASIIGLHHPAVYAAIESWSGYFRPTNRTGTKTLHVGSAEGDAYASVHALVPSLVSQFEKYPTFFAFYVGASDPVFVADNEILDRQLTAAGIPHLFSLYQGAHTTSLWQAHATAWLRLALAHLASARGEATPESRRRRSRSKPAGSGSRSSRQSAGGSGARR